MRNGCSAAGFSTDDLLADVGMTYYSLHDTPAASADEEEQEEEEEVVDRGGGGVVVDIVQTAARLELPGGPSGYVS